MKPRWAENLAVLGLPKQASWEQIEDKFRQLVLAHHPDLIGSGREPAERFRRIVASYEELALRREEQLEYSPAYLLQLLEDPKVRGLTVEELGDRLRYSSSPRLRVAAAHLLSQKGGEQSRRLLIQELPQAEGQLGLAVLTALGRVGKPGDLLPFLPRLWLAGLSWVGPFLGSGLRIWIRALRARLPARWR